MNAWLSDCRANVTGVCVCVCVCVCVFGVGAKKKKRKKQTNNKKHLKKQTKRPQKTTHKSTAYKRKKKKEQVASEQCLLVGCLTSQQHESVSQGRICSNNFTCCHTEIEVADQTFYLTQSQYTDTGPTSPSAGPITPGVWQGSHWSANF